MTESMHIGRLAGLAGTTTRTVRYYEEMGLINPVGRSPGGFRRYTADQLQRLRMILSLKRLEFDLEHIKRIMNKRDCNQTGGGLASDILSDLRKRLTDVDTQLGHLNDLRKNLAQTVATLCSCEPCDRRLADRLCSECEVVKIEGNALPFFHTLPMS